VRVYNAPTDINSTLTLQTKDRISKEAGVDSQFSDLP
jgi:hypothetical protein